jgi:hypothetical protein
VFKGRYHVRVTREVWTTSDDVQTLSKNDRVVDMDDERNYFIRLGKLKHNAT